MEESKEPKYKKHLEGIDSLSLGISIVVAVLMGVGLGLLLKNLFDSVWLLWLGVFWGVAGAILNIYRVYKRELKGFDEIAKKYDYKREE